jgi:hypothetical protein
MMFATRDAVTLYTSGLPSAGLAIILPLAELGSAIVCLVTAFLGSPQSGFVHENGLTIPAYLDQAKLHSWLLSHPRQQRKARATLRS